MWWLWLLVIRWCNKARACSFTPSLPMMLESSNNNVMILKAESTSDLKMTSSTRKNWYEVDNRHPLCNWVNDALCSKMRNFVWSGFWHDATALRDCMNCGLILYKKSAIFDWKSLAWFLLKKHYFSDTDTAFCQIAEHFLMILLHSGMGVLGRQGAIIQETYTR